MKHFLRISDLSAAELWDLLYLAEALKRERQQKGQNRPLLAGKTLGMIFQKPSLRTRVSFDMGMRHLGGDALYLSPDEVGLGKRESVADVARVLSGYVDAIMARVFAHAHIEELARYSRVPVINGLSDFNHPCQALADVFTIYEHKPKLENVTVAYVGDGNNVTTSLMHACALLGMNFVAASPTGYEVAADQVATARTQGTGEIWLTHSPQEAVQQADVIYTDVWTSMGQEGEAQVRAGVFPPYQVNQNLIDQAPQGVLVMHCLPAHRGQEITDEVADGPNSLLFQQAENRMHAQKAVLVRLLGKDEG